MSHASFLKKGLEIILLVLCKLHNVTTENLMTTITINSCLNRKYPKFSVEVSYPTLKIIAADLLITKFAACNLKPVNLWLIIEL